MGADMATASDFRDVTIFKLSNVGASGKDVGRNVYWKLYVIENTVRIIIHSVLTAQINMNWWGTATTPTLQKKALGLRKKYMTSPWHTVPGNHDIYYIDLADLNEIIRANSHLFLPVIPDIDQWMARIEQIRLPRNVVAHMNWPNKTDRKRIDVFVYDIESLARNLGNELILAAP